MKKVEALQRENHVLAFIHPDTSDSRDEAPGATPVLNNIRDSSSLVGDQSDVQSANSFILVNTEDQSDAQSISDASSRSAKCFPPNTVLPGADGHLLRVEKLRIGDRVRLRDLTDAKVARIEAHRKRPYDLVELTTRQGRFTVSKDHRVAVPGPGCQGAQRADQLSEGDLVIVGGKNQKLTKVSHLQECTVLYEVVFEEDQSVQMFHIESYGLVTSGSAVAAESAASASDGPLPALEHIGPGN
ncbi:unnamed protein product [Effrenium voratum]|nr:unnamed protein product [Effrenium voratum]